MDNHLVNAAAARLQTLATDNPRMAEAVEYYRCLIPALFAAIDQISPIALPVETINRKLLSGEPLLVGEELSIEPRDCREIFLSICQALRHGFASRGPEGLGEYQPGWADVHALQLDRIIANVENGSLYPLTLLSAFDPEGSNLIPETAERLDLDARLLELLAINTLKAFLHAWRRGLQPMADLDTWQHSLCPFCGNAPTLAEVQGTERARYLRCLHCGARWPYPNLQCAFCENNDHSTLGILQLESEKHRYYAHTCDRCHHYIKTVATFDPLPIELLPAEDLATLHLDTLAAEKGYQ